LGGGEEFLLILPETELEGAAVLGERVLEEVSERLVVLGDGRSCAVTLSAGATDGEARARDLFVRLADDALYRAKAAGRNRRLNREDDVS